jgi:hypothetical protein
MGNQPDEPSNFRITPNKKRAELSLCAVTANSVRTTASVQLKEYSFDNNFHHGLNFHGYKTECDRIRYLLRKCLHQR